jgi:hypothetical protein
MWKKHLSVINLGAFQCFYHLFLENVLNDVLFQKVDYNTAQIVKMTPVVVGFWDGL